MLLARTKAAWHVPKENPCCASVLNDTQGVRRSVNLVPLGTMRSESVFSWVLLCRWRFIL